MIKLYSLIKGYWALWVRVQGSGCRVLDGLRI